eukprot:Lithocolla_globosa_v1_NODE_1965_length_2237_cov_3.448671.p2 type:complete len:107 gc:universal NODE_1965_length_2237_cov_3.448671:463-143(-)
MESMPMFIVLLVGPCVPLPLPTLLSLSYIMEPWTGCGSNGKRKEYSIKTPSQLVKSIPQCLRVAPRWTTEWVAATLQLMYLISETMLVHVSNTWNLRQQNPLGLIL